MNATHTENFKNSQVMLSCNINLDELNEFINSNTKHQRKDNTDSNSPYQTMSQVSLEGMHGILGAELIHNIQYHKKNIDSTLNDGSVDMIALQPPRLITACQSENRPGYESVKANEYLDEENTLRAKVKIVAELIKKSQRMCAYTGAGISTASGIKDYASDSAGLSSLVYKLRTFHNKRIGMYQAQPTLAHYTLTSLYERGYLKHWIQQNHDGLPQKAGFPQHAINEIHGAWYDPSNPVVPMSGELRGDLFQWLEEWEGYQDLCLCLGTSLCGMNADRMVKTASKKFTEERNNHNRNKTIKQGRRKSISNLFGFISQTNEDKEEDQYNLSSQTNLGAIICSIQQTPYDDQSSVRIFCTIDKFAELLCEELELDLNLPKISEDENDFTHTYLVPKLKSENMLETEDCFILPLYNRDTGSIKQNIAVTNENDLILDLREGSVLRICQGMYKGDEGEVVGKDKFGNYKIRFLHKNKKNNSKFYVERRFGVWWISDAVEGNITQLPIINIFQRNDIS